MAGCSQDNDSEVARLLNLRQVPHTRTWVRATTAQQLPISLARLLSEETLGHLNVQSCLISAILAVLLIATAQEEFGIPECTTTIEAAGLDGPHRWGIILPNSSRVSLLTYKAIVAVRYPELVLHDQDPIQIGYFIPTITRLAGRIPYGRRPCGVVGRLPVVVRFPAGPQVSLKCGDQSKDNGAGHKKGRILYGVMGST